LQEIAIKRGAMRKGLIVVAGTIVLAGVAYAVYFAGALSLASECGDEIRKEVSSPDRAYVAEFFEQNCGATTGSTSIVSVRPHLGQLDGKEILVLDGVCAVDLSWTGHVLDASYAKSCKVARRSPSWRDVTIRFHEL
jgi:hypothetical protein